eukprot:433081_1
MSIQLTLQTQQEEYKFSPQQLLNTQKRFVEYHERDYMDCQTANHQFAACNAAKRILHVLNHYQQHKNVQMHEYVLSLKNYNFHMFMEDWHQITKNHLRGKDGINWITGIIDMQCANDIMNCPYVHRHQRNRGHETYNVTTMDIDYKNIIVTDKLDAIHTFIFHSIQIRNRRIQRITKSVQKTSKTNIDWSNKPDSSSACTSEQIIWIVNNRIFDILKPKQRAALFAYKSDIIQYLKDRKYDGSKLHEIARKTFITDMIKYLNVNNNKLKAPLAQLYTNIIKYDTSTLFENAEEKKVEDVWSNKPQLIRQCSVEQIASITDHVIQNKVDKLGEHKQNIINYIRQNNVDGNQFNQLEREQFTDKIASDLGNNELKSLLGFLRKNIIECDLSIFTGVPYDIMPSSKFESKMDEGTGKDSYYSFGIQYRYTKNLEQHPYYVKAKHNSLKEELRVYFAKIQDKDTDLNRMLNLQFNAMQSFNKDLRLILTPYVKLEVFNDMIWQQKDVDQQYLMSISSIVHVENKMCQKLIQIIKLCFDINDHEEDPEDDENDENDEIDEIDEIDVKLYHVYWMFRKLFKTKFEAIQKHIKDTLKQHIQSLNESDVTRYYANIEKYTIHEFRENSEDVLVNDTLSIFENISDNTVLEFYKTESKSNGFKFIKDNFIKKRQWIKSYVEEHQAEFEASKLVIDIIYEISKPQKHMFYAYLMQHDNSLGLSFEIAKDILAVLDINNLQYESHIKLEYQKMAKKVINNIVTFNTNQYENTLLTDILTALIDEENKRCHDILASLDKLNVVNLMNLLQIKIIKMTQLNLIGLKKLNQIEDKSNRHLTEMITELNGNLSETHTTQCTNVVLEHFFQTLLQKEFSTNQSLIRQAIQQYVDLLQVKQPKKLKYCYEALQTYAKPANAKQANAKQANVNIDRLINEIIQCYKYVFDSNANLIGYVTQNTKQLRQLIRHAMKAQKHLIEKQLNQSKIVFVPTVLNIIFTITKRQFYDLSIQPQVMEYSILYEAAEHWVNNEVISVKTMDINTFDRNHLADVILDIFSVDIDLVKLNVSATSSYIPFAIKTIEKMIRMNIVSNVNALWMDDYKHDYSAVSVIRAEEESVKQLISILTKLCSNVHQESQVIHANFQAHLLKNLLKIKQNRFKEVTTLIYDNLKMYVQKLKSDEHDDEYSKSWPWTGQKRLLLHLLKNIQSYTDTSDSSALETVVNDVLKDIIENNIINSTDEINMHSDIRVLYNLILVKSIRQIHHHIIKETLNRHHAVQMLEDAETWFEDNIIPKLRLIKLNGSNQTIKQIMTIMHNKFSVNLYSELHENELKNHFIEFAIQTIQKTLHLNKAKYLESQLGMRCMPFIGKAESIIQMQTVKKMKASRYQGANADHRIKPDQPIQIDHVLALVLYSHCTELCTIFRDTYRKISNDESIFKQKKRHSQFANFGRLLYESFAFYASNDSKVQLLYHGMSIELLFSTLYCAFNAPTSTTTAASVAESYGQERGIVLTFESSESEKYIKTLDMDPFTCYHNEEEHLIFETRLHIKDIFLQR